MERKDFDAYQRLKDKYLRLEFDNEKLAAEIKELRAEHTKVEATRLEA